MDSLVKNGTSENLVDTCQNDEPLSSEAATDEKKRSVTFPKYRYNRDELLALRGARHSRMKPRKLSKEFELEDQKWDPDKWFYNIDRSADTQMQKPEKPLPRIPRTYNTEENVYDSKKPGVEFKRTLISSIGDSENIVLGPQRNSFTTGCNAARTTKRDASPRRDGKERNHRIGSGRVQVGDRRSEKPEYESNERRGGGGGGAGRYDNEWKDDRYSRRGDRRDGNSRGWTNQRDRSSEGLHRNDHRYAMGSRSHTEATSRGHAAEPEWFTRGPSSRNDVIELRGFGRRSDDGDVEAEKAEATKVTTVAGSGDSIQRKTEAETEKESSGAGKKRNATSANSESNQEKSNRTSVGERRTVASETGTQLQDAAADDVDARDNSGCRSADGRTDAAGQAKAQEFDFNDFFKDSVLKLIEPESVHEGSSRFKAFFNLQPSSRSTDYEGQQSSLLERFPTLTAIVDGHNQSPLPASPPIYGHRLVGSDEAQEKKRFLMMLEKANLLSNEDAKSTYFDEGKQKEFTADLKGILKVTPSAGKNARAEPQTIGRKVLPSGSKPLLAEELEANLLTDVSGKKAEQNLPHRPATSLPIGSKVTTLAELEGCLMTSKDGNQPQGHADNPDLSAFNKLLDFVQGVGKPSDQTAVNSSSQNAVFTTANSDLPSTLLKSIEQLGSSALDEPSGCPSLAMSLSGHQVRIQNRPVTPVTSSPIMFGTQPPTNLMMPQARRQIQQGQPSAPGVGFVVRPSHTAQRSSFVPEGTSVLGRPLAGLAPPSVAVSAKIGGQENWSPPRHGQFVPDAGRSNEVLATDTSSLADANAKQRTEAGKVSQSFTPTVVMRKMISERAASRNAGDKTNLLASDQLSQDLMDGTAASNESRYSNSLTASGVSHVATAGLPASSESASAALNSQQGTALQQNQILQMIKNHLSMSSSNSLPPHHQQQMADGGGSHAAASRGYLPSMGYPAQQQQQQHFLNYPAGTQMMGGGLDHLSSARWQATGNKHALDIMAQLRSQGQGQGKSAAAPTGSGYLPYRSSAGASSSQQQQQPMLAPADMAAILLQRLQNSSGPPMPGTQPSAKLPMGGIGPPPVGRAIVKGTGLQPQTHQTNQTNPLAAIQAMMLQQQQHQHPASVAYPGMPGPGALVPGAADHWSSASQPTTGTAVNSVHMNGGGTGIHGNSTASLSNGNYDSANLSRLFGESFLRHPQVAPMSSFQGHKTAAATAATMMTVDDLERRYALGASSAARLS